MVLRLFTRSLVALVAAVGLLEISLRVLRPRADWIAPFVYMPGTHTAFDRVETLDALLRKGSFNRRPFKQSHDFVLNSRAMRTIEYAVDKAEDTFRVVALGDSFTYASGAVPYPTLWHQRLRALLAMDTDQDVEMISLAVPAVGPDFEYRMWQLEGRHLRPELLILALFVGNDFRDIHGELGASSGIDDLARRSLAVRAVRNLLLMRTSRVGLTSKRAPLPREEWTEGGFVIPDHPDEYDPLDPSMGREAHLTLEARRAEQFGTVNRAAFEEGLRRACAIVESLHDEATDLGASFLLVVIPDEFQVDEELFSALRAERDLTLDPADVDLAQRSLAEFCEARGIRVLDLLPAFREAGRSRKLYRLQDTHWNVEGNALAAERIAEAVRDLLAR